MTAEQEIKTLLDQKNITAYRLCKDLDIPRGTMSRYLSGQHEMSANRYLEIKRYLNK